MESSSSPGYGVEYYFDYPATTPIARFIMIIPGNTGTGYGYDYTSGPHYEFVQAAVNDAKSLGLWTIIVMHEECIASVNVVLGRGCDTDSTGNGNYGALLRLRPDLILHAHNHVYERSKQISTDCSLFSSYDVIPYDPSCVIDDGLDNNYARGAGTIIVTQGTGGAGLYDVLPSPANYFVPTGMMDFVYPLSGADGRGAVKYTVSSDSITVQTDFDTSYSDSWSIGGSPPPPGPLTAGFTFTPSVVHPGDTVTFTATITGGTSPYVAAWTFGDGTTATGTSVTHSYGSEGTFDVSLLVTDALGSTASASKSVSVTSSAGAPIIVGWGGPKGDESSIDSPYQDGSNPPSQVFSGEQASNFEIQVIRLQSMGFNAVRFSFAPSCTNPDGGFMYPYSQTNLERAIAIAEHFDFWIIVDYHGYEDLSTTSLADCWLNFWGPVVQQFKDRYSKLIWEPLNEPTNLPGGDDVAYLSLQYQRWIDQARALGDQHWIVVQNLCSFSCGLADMADGFPTVTDPLGRVFTSLHSYIYYPGYSSSWNDATAESVAQSFYQAVVDGIARTGWPALNTEGGTDPLCRACAPDTILDGSAGYTTVSFHFIQTLTTLYDTHTPRRINWVWWPMASWTDTPNSRPYGALQCGSDPEAWGCLLNYQPVTSTTNSPPVISVPPSQSVNEGTVVSFTVSASDSDSGQIVTLSAGGLPSGASFDPATGGFSWNPSEAQGPGDYTVSFTATDDGSPSLSDTKFVSMHVSEVNLAPVLAIIGNKNVNEQTGLSFTASATDSDLPTNTLSYSLGPGTPSGASINPSAGIFVWTPTEAQGPGTYSIAITVSDGSLTDSETFTITVAEVNVAPILNVPGPQAVSVGDTLMFSVTATDPDVPANTITLSVTGLVSGMAFNPATGQFTFVPTQDQNGQTFTVSFTATDSGTPSLSDTRSVQLTVAAFINSPPVLDPISDRSVDEGTLLTFAVTASDPDTGQVLTFSLGPGAPAGASITVDGVFTWTPSETQGPGTYILTIIVNDNGSPQLTDFQTISILVAEVNMAPHVVVPGSQTINEATTLTFTITAIDPDVPASILSLSATSLPSGASFDPVTGTFSWVPGENQGPGTHVVTFQVSDGSLTDAGTVSISVTEVNSPPVLTTPGQSQLVAVGNTLTLTIRATDPDSPPNTLTLSAEGLVSGMSFPTTAGPGSVEGVFTFTPSSSQTGQSFTVTFGVADDGNPQLYGQMTITITVQPPTPPNTPPTLNVPVAEIVNETQLVTFDVSATDPDQGQVITLTCDNCSGLGATFDPVNGQFSWVPSEAQGPGQYDITFTASDGLASTTASVSIYVDEINEPPVLAIPETLHVREGDVFSFTVNVTDPDIPSNQVTVSVTGLPDGASFDPASRIFYWNLSTVQPGVYYVTFTATDDGSPSYSESKTLTIHTDRGEGRCFICEIFPAFTSNLLTNMWLMTVGGLIGLTVTVGVYFHMTHSRLVRARRSAAGRHPPVG